MRIDHVRRAVVVTVATTIVACATPDGALRLPSPPCRDDSACAAGFEFDGRVYSYTDTGLTDLDIARLELDRFEVADPGFDVLVTTDDPSVVYLRARDRWLEAHATD